MGSGDDHRRSQAGPEGIQMSRAEGRGTTEGARVAGQGSSSTGWPPPVERSSCPEPASQAVMRGYQLQSGWEKGTPVASQVLEKSILVCMLGRGIAVQYYPEFSRNVFVEHHFLHKLSLPFPGVKRSVPWVAPPVVCWLWVWSWCLLWCVPWVVVVCGREERLKDFTTPLRSDVVPRAGGRGRFLFLIQNRYTSQKLSASVDGPLCAQMRVYNGLSSSLQQPPENIYIYWLQWAVN